MVQDLSPNVGLLITTGNGQSPLMSIVVAVKTQTGTAIAADTLSANSLVCTPAKYRSEPTKLLRCGGSIMGFVGDCISQDVFSHLADVRPDGFDFTSKQTIFKSLLGIHELLKTSYFMQPEECEDSSFELSPIHAIIANQHGIFSVTHERHVSEYTQFWAIGCGAQLALGAMHALYNRCEDARTVATTGVEAACEFDVNCGLPLECCTIEKAPIPKKKTPPNGHMLSTGRR